VGLFKTALIGLTALFLVVVSATSSIAEGEALWQVEDAGRAVSNVNLGSSL
jgi:hypothetical protein